MRRNTDGPRWSHLAMEAALCVWEELLNRFDNTTEHAALNHFWGEAGTVHMRSLSPAIGSWIVESFSLVERDSFDGHAYDWEIVPAYVDLIVWDTGGCRPMLPCPKAAAKAVCEKLGGALLEAA